ncbi:MAG: penicillin-binding protein 2, partial [Candidatus Obscuribacterales bacterium]|nr:penicillin-binding protein 2 [Candidatus Obscuribacterales bacterium]
MPSTIDLTSYRRDGRRRRPKPRTPLFRLRVWQVLLLLGALAICGRLYYLQIYRGDDLTKKACEQRQKTHLLIHRGAITDRHGLPLAIDTTRYDLFVHPHLLKVSAEEAASTIAGITKRPHDNVLKRLKAGYPVVTVAKHLEREVVDELQNLNWPGMDIVPQAFRHYPEGKLAAHMLGYVNNDTRGQGGVEQAHHQTLTSTGSIPKPQLDGRGRTILLPHKGPSWDITPPLGRHVELTIDNALQHLAEKELNAMAIHSRCDRASAIVADPTTGEILAWANYPNYDPNEYSKYPFATTKNWAMVDVYQPGSTFKVITVASALETGAITEKSTFQDSAGLTIGRQTIHNHHGGHGTIDLLQLFIHSSNVCAAKVAMKMTPGQFYDKLYEFGLGRKTGIDLPGESRGLLLRKQRWTPIDQATTGFGQGAIAVTPLQLVAAVGTIANDGTWIQPHIIRRVYDPKTSV